MPAPFNRKKKIILITGDLLLMLLSIYLGVFIRSHLAINVLEIRTGATVFSILTYLVCFYIFDLYNLSLAFRSRMYLIRFVAALLLSTLIIAIIFYFFPSWKFGRGIFLINMFLIGLSIYGWRLVFRLLFSVVNRTNYVAIVGAGAAASAIYNVLKGQQGFEVKCFVYDSLADEKDAITGVPALETSRFITELENNSGLDTIVVATPLQANKEFVAAVVNAKMKGVEVYDMPRLYERVTGKIPVNHLSDRWLLYTPFSGDKPESLYAAYKEAFGYWSVFNRHCRFSAGQYYHCFAGQARFPGACSVPAEQGRHEWKGV